MEYSIIKRLRRVSQLKRQIGFRATTMYVIKRLLTNNSSRHSPLVRKDVSSFYDFVRDIEFGRECDITETKTINWVIPDFRPGSGGHLNIFRLICGLEKRGYKCRIILVGGTAYLNARHVKEMINKHFFSINAEIYIGHESMPCAWATVATSWQTAYVVRNFRGTQHKLYFVQDFEPYFYANGSEFIFAERTYKFGFQGIAAGEWLASKLFKDYGMKTISYGFSYDRSIYEEKIKKESNKKHIFFYARPVTPRRGFELGLMAINEVVSKREDIAVIFAGWDVSEYKIDYPHFNAGIVPVEELAELYSQCDVALVLSFTNISLLPLELMACGCPVVSNNGENVEWLLNERNSVCAEPTPKALSSAILELLNNEEKRKNLSESAKNFATSTSWELEIDKIGKLIEELGVSK